MNGRYEVLWSPFNISASGCALSFSSLWHASVLLDLEYVFLIFSHSLIFSPHERNGYKKSWAILKNFNSLAHESRDLSQAKKKIIVVTSWGNQLFPVKMVRFEKRNVTLSENSCHFVKFFRFWQELFLSQLEINHEIHQQTAKNWHRCRGPWG